MPAALDRVTVQVEFCPELRLVGLQTSELSDVGGEIVIVALWALPL
jgi:hypothetical protein